MSRSKENQNIEERYAIGLRFVQLLRRAEAVYQLCKLGKKGGGKLYDE